MLGGAKYSGARTCSCTPVVVLSRFVCCADANAIYYGVPRSPPVDGDVMKEFPGSPPI